MSLKTNLYSRYLDRSLPWLKKKAQTVFNKFIRERDKDKGCISCLSWNIDHASHFYSMGHHLGLAYNEDNVHGSCLRCNYFLGGNLNEYRKRLEKRIGLERLQKLDELSLYYKRNPLKPDKFYYIEIILKYG
jgi:hypothetical protein